MIDQIYINGVPVLKNGIGLIGMKGWGGAGVDMTAYARGNRSGVALSTPFYRSFAASLTFEVWGQSAAEFLSNRDTLLQLFSHVEDKTQNQFQPLKFVLSNGSVRIADVLIGQAVGDVDTNNKLHAPYLIPFETELEYLKGETLQKTIYIYNAGGMPIPMAIPMDMSQNPSVSTTELINSGNAPSRPTMRVYGPMTEFDLVNQTTGKTLSCTEELATEADYIDLDFYNETALKNGTTNVKSTISGTWWWLAPGSNLIKLSSTSTSTVARAVVDYFPAFRNV